MAKGNNRRPKPGKPSNHMSEQKKSIAIRARRRIWRAKTRKQATISRSLSSDQTTRSRGTRGKSIYNAVGITDQDKAKLSRIERTLSKIMGKKQSRKSKGDAGK